MSASFSIEKSTKNGTSFRFGQPKSTGSDATKTDTESAMPEPSSKENEQADAPPTVPAAKFSRLTEIKVNLHRQVLDKMNLSAIDQMTPEQFQESVGELVQELVEEAQTPLNQTEKKQLVSELINEILGLGPLEPLLADPSITDILINTYEHVFVERGGQLSASPTRFKDDAHLRRIIDKIVSTVGRRLDESQPLVDARLKDGSRVNAVIPPIAVDGPLLSIRKFAKTPINMERLIELGALPHDAAELLRGIVAARQNVLISGGTGSGKTTMLNAMSAFIGGDERIVTIEDAAELQLQQNHVARLETRVANIEGRGEITQRDLVKNALRMRPDRIIVGEVRGGEAFDMLQAMNTGHDGSMTTIHANTCRDALGRLEQMISMANLDISAKAMREQIASAVHVILQVTRMSDGSRRAISLNEVTGMEGEVITLQEIFKYERHSVDDDGVVIGQFVATGIRPDFISEFETRSIPYPKHMFNSHGPLE
jgi:pilus assembly protein CpaF